MTQLTSPSSRRIVIVNPDNGGSAGEEPRQTGRRNRNRKQVEDSESDTLNHAASDHSEAQGVQDPVDLSDAGGRGSDNQVPIQSEEDHLASVPGSGDENREDTQADSGGNELAQWTAFERKDFYTDLLVERISKMLAYQNDGDRLYALSRVPLNRVDWGNKDTTLTRLCIRGENTPITVWVFGHVTSLWFYNNEGEPNSKVSIGVAPLTQHAKFVAKTILEKFAKPVDTLEPYIDHVSASRWQTERVPGEKMSQKLPFRACYDARERYQSKARMSSLPVENLKKGDLVLLEAQVTRYSTAADGGKRQNMTAKERAKNKAKGPTEWKVTFELVSVSLLSERPPSLDVDPVASGPDFKDSF